MDNEEKQFIKGLRLHLGLPKEAKVKLQPENGNTILINAPCRVGVPFENDIFGTRGVEQYKTHAVFTLVPLGGEFALFLN
jgi:hypothetical protein